MPSLSGEIDEISSTPIQKFYSGSSVFITGATGFLGKALIEKLARSCPNIGTLYLLVRDKKGKGLQQRIDDLFDDTVFERLKSECPNFRHKMIGIAGDCGLPVLGIGENDRQLLCNEVSVVFHVAATVRFDEKLKLAIEINVRGTRELLKMCSEMRKLKSVVHVSTAFSNCAQGVIEEIFYPVPMEGRTAILAAEHLSDEILDNMTPKLLEKYPNTYALTKAIAEDVVKDIVRTLPIGIFRPSIVISSYKEPVEGWVDNIYGVSGMCVGIAAGIIRTAHCDSKAIANLIPIDMCVNGLIAIAWDVDQSYRKSKRQCTAHVGPIYNYESSTDRPINWKTYVDYTARFGTIYPPMGAMWYYSITFIKNRMVYLVLHLILHYVPALLVDGAQFCMGKKPRLLKIYKKVDKVMDILTYFSTNNFKFASTRMRSLISNMSPQDQTIFFCDLKRLDWEEYFKTYFKGIRVYLMKDPLSTLDVARNKYRRLYWLHQGCKLLLFFVALRIFWCVFMMILAE